MATTMKRRLILAMGIALGLCLGVGVGCGEEISDEDDPFVQGGGNKERITLRLLWLCNGEICAEAAHGIEDMYVFIARDEAAFRAENYSFESSPKPTALYQGMKINNVPVGRYYFLIAGANASGEWVAGCKGMQELTATMVELLCDMTI
ncbi:MAG: hypothetical protein LBM75_07470 [Myxococcales bacterium]|jgi:hypothetical protein|nr:hypothetical protein [Myxococcales bacterium]